MKNTSIPHWATYGILFVVAFMFVFLFSCTTSPLYEHYPFWFHGDSGIFQEMGVCLLQGGTPYVDLFDHKGPVLWFLQALGIMISPRWGLVALQTISLFCTMLIWYKTIRILIEKQVLSIIISICGLIFLLAFYERGNLCEEWSLPFISLPVFLYAKGLTKTTNIKESIYNHTDTFLIGLCVGVLAMIRLNNTAPIIGFVLWHFIRCVQLKEYKRLLTDIVLISCGMAIIIIACGLYYLINAGWGGVYEMLYGTFLFNFLYINDVSNLSYGVYIMNYVPAVGCILISTICYFHKKASINLSLPVIISVVISLLSIGRFGFLHYMMIIIPLLVLSFCLIIHTSTHWAYIILGLVFIHSAYLGYDDIDHFIFRLKGNKTDSGLNDGFHRFITSIPDNERKSIFNAGLNHMGAGMFADENIYQCNRIIYKIHSDISPHLREYELTHGISELQPSWVLTQSPRPKAVDEYMKTNYILADSISGGQFDPVWCWKKKLL